MVSRAIPFPPIEAQPSEALPTDPFKAFLRVKRTSDSRSNDSPGTLHQLWIRSQPSPFSTQQPLGPFFYAWGLDLIGPINPNSSKQDIWIITATEYIYSFRSVRVGMQNSMTLTKPKPCLSNGLGDL